MLGHAEQEAAQFVTRYVDGAARGMRFRAPHLLDVSWARGDTGKPTVWTVDLAQGTVVKGARGAAVDDGEGALGWCDIVGGRAAINGPAYVDVRELGKGARDRRATGDVDVDEPVGARCAKQGRSLQKLQRTGKYPNVRLRDDGAAVFSSASEVLSVFDVKSGKCTGKLKCWDKVTHVALGERLLACRTRRASCACFRATPTTSTARRVSRCA